MLKDAWALAVKMLSLVELKRLSEQQALAQACTSLRIRDANAVRFGYGLACETLRRLNLIDALIGHVIAPMTLKDFSPQLQSFLRLYVYHNRFACPEQSVDVDSAILTARLGRSILGWRAMMVAEPFLGFLLTCDVESIFQGLSDESRISLATFNPEWFVRYCIRIFGREWALSFLRANSIAPPVYIRLNTLKLSEEEILHRLYGEGLLLEKVVGLAHVYRVVSSKTRLTSVASYGEGLFYVQDKASCLAAEVAGVQPGMFVLDVCAAPGAKTTYLAQLMQGKGLIFSVDYSARRMAAWRREVFRMGVANTEAVLADARANLPLGVEADVVVLDPPCTGTGAFGRYPASKWRLTEASVQRMAEVQWRMLMSCSEKVRSGGVLVYSTCSITLEENELLIERFLKWNPEFRLQPASPWIGDQGLNELKECQRLYPHRHSCNGFFVAKLVRF